MTTVTYPVAPQTTQRKGTLLDAASTSENFAWAEAENLFESYNCMKFESAADFCAPNAKTFDNDIAWQSGIKFATYGGVLCKGVGLDTNRLTSEIERVFRQGESIAVERALMAQRFKADALWGAAPVDLTPSTGAVCPEVGVAILEGHAAANYAGGVPTLHMPVAVASVMMGLGGQVAFENGVLLTKMGAKVAAGGGYDYPNLSPTGATAAEGEKWLYATGEVLVVQGPLDVREAIDFENNDVYALAEHPNIAVVDCYTAAVRVQVSC